MRELGCCSKELGLFFVGKEISVGSYIGSVMVNSVFYIDPTA